MESRPTRRLSPARSFLVGALPVLLVFAAAVPLLAFLSWVRSDRGGVVVAFDARSGEPSLDRALHQELVSQLSGASGVRILADIPLPSAENANDPRPKAWTRRSLCGETGADYVFSGAMSKDKSHYLLGVQVTVCASGEKLLAERVELVSRDQLPEVVQWLASMARRLAS